jgi:hypothetical protein
MRQSGMRRARRLVNKLITSAFVALIPLKVFSLNRLERQQDSQRTPAV